MHPGLRVFLISLAGILGLGLIGVLWLASEIQNAKSSNPYKLGDRVPIDRRVQPDYAGWHDPSRDGPTHFNRSEAVPGGCLRYGTETVWREVNGDMTGTRSHRFPKGEIPGCGDFVRQDTVERYGAYVEPWACHPYLIGVVMLGDSRTRYAGSDIYLARVPGGPPAESYVDPTTGTLTDTARARLPVTTFEAPAGARVQDPADFSVTIRDYATCEGYELWKISLRPK